MMVQQTHKSSNPASARRTMERIDRLMEAMFEKYDAPKDVLAKDVSDVIEKLRKVGALYE